MVIIEDVISGASLEVTAPPPGKLVTNPADLYAIMDELHSANKIAIDVETTGLDYIRDALHGVSLATEKHEWYITGPALGRLLGLLSYLVQDPGKLWIGHNIKFDLHFLGRYGIAPARIVDTMIAQWLVDENVELALKTLAHTRLGYPDNLPSFPDLLKEAKARLGRKRMDQVSIWDVDLVMLADYAARDTRLTYDMWLKLEYDLEKEGQTKNFWEIEMPFVWVLLEMEENGLPIDQNAVATLEGEFMAEMKAAQKQWDDITGGVNPRSGPQIAEWFFVKQKLPVQTTTKTGKPSTDDLVMQRLEKIDTSGSAKALRAYKKYEKMCSTYIAMLKAKPYQGRLNGSFNQTGTVTGRLSSSDPNLQNIPARGDLGKKMRSVFGVKDNRVLVVCDYSQIELRMLANESKEPNFLKVFEEDGDPHQMTADRASVPRPIGKRINFGWAYGMGPKRLCDTIEEETGERPELTDSKLWLNNFDGAYPTLVRWKSLVVNRARQLGYVPSITGRKRRLPDLYAHDEGIRKGAERQCVNSRIQGSCADMLKWAMIQLTPWVHIYDAKMVAQVHDELVFEIDTERVDDFMNIVQGVMESIQEHFNLQVKIIAEPGKGLSWAEAK